MTDRPAALLVSHGQPSDPDGPEADLRTLAESVAKLLPGWRVMGTTLSGKGTLEAAIRRLGTAVTVYPLFMTDGWFVRDRLPSRLAEAGATDCTILPPLGLDPALPDLCLRRAGEAALAAGITPSTATLLLAAHGSPSAPRAGEVAREVAATLEAAGVFRCVVNGFVDEAPFLADAARIEGPAVCLPFFAAANGHVREDIPEGLDAAGFSGLRLPPVGTDGLVPGLIADALRRSAAA